MVNARWASLVTAAGVLAVSPAFGAGVTYTAQVESLQVVQDEPFILNITVTADGNQPMQELTLPDVGGLRVLGNNRSEGTTVQIGANGTMFRRTIRIVLTLAAERPGKVVIGKGRVRSGNDVVESQSFALRVMPAGSSARAVPPPAAAQPPDEPDVAVPPPPVSAPNASPGIKASPAMLKAGLFSTLEADRPRVMLGEQVVLTIRLFSRTDVTDIEALRLPKMEGFWSEILENPTRIAPTLVMVEGQRYQAYLLRRMAVFPTRAGEFELAPVEADLVTGGGFLSPGRRHRVGSLPLTLTVDPLPAEGQPPGFQAGNVGRFTLDARLDRARTSMSQPATLTIRIDGHGNLRQASVPRLTDTPDLRVYDPTPAEDIHVAANRFQGYKQLEFLVQPKHTGTITLPRITFPFFDTEARRYVTLQAPPLKLDVVGDDDKTAPGRTTSAPGTQARPLRTDPEPRSHALPAMTDLPLPWAWLATPLLLGLASVVVGGSARRRRQRVAGDGSLRARAAAKQLHDAVDGGGDPAVVSAALTAFLGARVGPQVTGMTRAELSSALVARGVHRADADRLTKVMDRLDAARYAASTDGGGGILAAETLAVVRSLDASLGGGP